MNYKAPTESEIQSFRDFDSLLTKHKKIDKINLTLKQYDIAKTLSESYDAIDKLQAIKYIKSIYGSKAEIKDIIIAYKHAYES